MTFGAAVHDRRFLFPPRMTPAIPHEFDRRAAQYERHAPVQREAAEWLAEWLPEELDGPALELGAGTGLFTKHLARRTPQLVATDVAPNMVQAGKESLPEVEWTIADASAPPGDRNYRWILSCSLVQWLPDPAAAFRAWHQAAAAGARLVSGWFAHGTMTEFFDLCPEASPFVWRDADEWRDLLTAAGWSVQRHETRLFVRRYEDSAAMLRQVHSAGAIVPRRLGAGRLRRTLREYDRNHRGEEGVAATFKFLRVEAVRS